MLKIIKNVDSSKILIKEKLSKRYVIDLQIEIGK